MTVLTVTDTSIPDHPENEPWAHVLLLPNGRCHFADTATELIDKILSSEDVDYLGMDSDGALIARYEAAVAMAATIQTGLNRKAVESGTLVLEQAGETVLTALHVEKTVPWEGMPDAGFGDEARWTHDVPLVLIATDYYPYTQRQKPTGNLAWIDPGTETTFLSSLNGLGLVGWSVYRGND